MAQEIVKITDGYVEQVFDPAGKCLRQRFVAGNSELENEGFLNADVTDVYYPFDMIQPDKD